MAGTYVMSYTALGWDGHSYGVMFGGAANPLESQTSDLGQVVTGAV